MNEGHLTGGATIGHTAGSHSGTRGETGPSGVSGAWAVSQYWTLDMQGQQGAGGTCGCAMPAYSLRRKKLLKLLKNFGIIFFNRFVGISLGVGIFEIGVFIHEPHLYEHSSEIFLNGVDYAPVLGYIKVRVPHKGNLA